MEPPSRREASSTSDTATVVLQRRLRSDVCQEALNMLHIDVVSVSEVRRHASIIAIAEGVRRGICRPVPMAGK